MIRSFFSLWSVLGALLVTGVATAQPTFDPVQSFPVNPPVPGTVAALTGGTVADVDGDADQDLVFVGKTPGQGMISVFLGDGTGSFVPGPELAIDGVGEIRAIDLDGNAAEDLVVATPLGLQLLIADGTGGYGLGPSYQSSVDRGELAVADMNGDSLADTVVLSDGGTVAIRPGTGQGTLGNPGISISPTPLSQVLSAAVADMDGDQDVDVVFGTLSEVVLATNDGLGGITGFTTILDGTKVPLLALEDLDGNATVDLVAAGSQFQGLAVSLQDTAGGFGALTTFSVGSSPAALEVAPLDGNATPDALTTVGFEAVALPGDGLGGFGAATPVAPQVGAVRFVVGFLDGDSLLDLVVLDSVQGNVTVLRNTSIPPAPATFRRGDVTLDGALMVNDPVALLDHLFNGGPMVCDDSGDLDDDGSVNIADVIALLGYLFIPGSAVPSAPGPQDCGLDPTADALGGCQTACP